MKTPRKSNCIFSIEGIVLDKDCNRILGHAYCDIDAWSPGINCTENGCYYYTRREPTKKEHPKC